MEMFTDPNGSMSTGPFVGRIKEMLGMGGVDWGNLKAMGKDAAITKLAEFKGATSDFEFAQSEAVAFANVLFDEDVNIGTLERVQEVLTRQREAHATLAQQGYEGIKQYSLDKNHAADTIRRFGSAPEGVIDSELDAIDPGEAGVRTSTDTNSGAGETKTVNGITYTVEVPNG
jgi:hypothetical protein